MKGFYTDKTFSSICCVLSKQKEKKKQTTGYEAGDAAAMSYQRRDGVSTV